MALSDLQGTIIAQTIVASLTESSAAQRVFGSPIVQTAIGMQRGAVIRVPKTTSLVDSVDDTYSSGDIDSENASLGYADVALDKVAALRLTIGDVDLATLSVDPMAAWALEIGRGIAGAIDKVVLADAVTAATAIENDDPVGEGRSAADVVSDLKVALSENNVGLAGRYIFAGPAFTALLQKELAWKATAMGDAALMSGQLGQFDGFTVIETNYIDSDTVLAAGEGAFAFAAALNRSGVSDNPKGFETFLKAITVYGCAAIQTEALSKATWRSGS